jgi:site-specific DNA recombinase
VHLTEKVRERIWSDVRDDAGERAVIVQKDIERQQRSIKKLEENQARLVQLSYQGLVSDEVLASEQHRLEAEKLQAQRLLHAAELQATDIATALDGVLEKTSSPQATYIASTPLERRLLNQALFKRILVGEEGQVLGATLTPIYAALAAWEPDLGTPHTPPAHQGPQRKNPDPDFQGQGSYVKPMVETVGIEPTSMIA